MPFLPKIAHDSEETSLGWAMLVAAMMHFQVLCNENAFTIFTHNTHTLPPYTCTPNPHTTGLLFDSRFFPISTNRCATSPGLLSSPIMAMIARGQAQPAQPQQPPSFIILPDIAHATIASSLPDGDKGTDNRLRVSEVSRALHEAYGGSLTSASIYYTEGGSSSLVALLRRQKILW